ncbi:MAG: MCE family protein [Phycisphaerales bacterium]|nr:MCE family protein [Phycisphaerales bacterium]
MALDDSQHTDKETTEPATDRAVHRAVLVPNRRISWAWLLPIAALALVLYLSFQAYQARGFIVDIQFDQGHGLRPGGEVRYRGITIGEVRSLDLAPTGEGVIVKAALHLHADRIARSGSRFWIVRPSVGLDRIQGLETVVGARYMAVAPGPAHAPKQRRFVGLREPPVVESTQAGDLEIVLHATERGSLAAGAPVTYRGVRIGTVLSVGLASDANGVEARLHVEKAYRQLVCEATRFWDAGGLKATVGMGGISVEIDSIESLVSGSVALATPEPHESGEPVRTGHRFELAREPKEAWLEWEPVAAIGSSLLPPGASMPVPLRAAIAWKQGWLGHGERTRHGWVLQTEKGLLGPADLLKPGEKAKEGSVGLEVAGQIVALASDPTWELHGLALLQANVTSRVWHAHRCRVATEVEDCLAVADPTAPPLPLAAARLTIADDAWEIDPALPIDESWHGACVLARGDGRLVGIILVDDQGTHVALLPDDL